MWGVSEKVTQRERERKGRERGGGMREGQRERVEGGW